MEKLYKMSGKKRAIEDIEQDEETRARGAEAYKTCHTITAVYAYKRVALGTLSSQRRIRLQTVWRLDVVDQPVTVYPGVG